MRHSGTVRSHFLYMLVLMLLASSLVAPALLAQNLGKAPATGQAVQGQSAAQVEGSIANVVNWVANVICPTIAGLAVVATVLQWRSGKPWLPTAATAGGLLAVSAILRLIEYFISNGQAIG
jgi:hypothetical protein